MTSKIDLDRGVVVSRMPLDKGGMYIYMYQDDPGIYVNEHGHRIAESLASEVGFDTKRWQKERIKRDRIAQFKSEVEAELELASVERETVVKEAKGFTIVELPGGRGNVKDPDGNLMNIQPISMADAEALLVALTPEAPEPLNPKPLAKKGA